MNKKVLQKIQKKVVAFVLTFAMLITGLYVLEPAGSVANATSNQTLFAGYYTDNTYETPSATKTDFEKIVSSDVLSVKLQVKKDSTGRYDMRVITTVDDLNYRTVGFDVWFGEAAENPTEDNVIPFETATVLERIKAKGTSVDYKFSPKVVDTESEYFVTGTIKGIHPKYVEVAGSEAPFYIKPFWTTLDGTKVYGESRYFTLQDGLRSTNINMSVKADGISGDTVTVAVDGTNVTADAVYTADGYAHLNIPVANKTALKSATKVVVGGLTTYYRNLESSYSGTADTSWYTVCQEAGDTEFVLATDADLYGLGALSGLSSTIYMVADIEANPDAPDTEGDWVSYIANNNPKTWTPIVDYKGLFDGQGHTLKGIYLVHSTDATYTGLFQSVKSSGTIQNLRVTNSYYKTTAAGGYGIGGIAGAAGGTYKNIYTDVIIHSDSANAGGIAGYIVSDGRGMDTVFENCWSNSDITTTNWKAGGIVGTTGTRGFVIKNCLNTGDVTGGNEYISGIIGGGGNHTGWSVFSIENCLNLGSITSFGVPTRAGAILGQDTSLTTASNLYYLDTNADRGVGQDTYDNTSKVAAITLTNLQGETAKTTLSGFDFDNVWTTTDDIPVLKGFEEYANDATPDGKVALTIGSLTELQAFATSASGYTKNQKVKLTANIEVNAGNAEDWAKGENIPSTTWTPINSFAGIFDGQGYEISGIYLDNAEQYTGFFTKVTETATIKNVRILNSYYHNTYDADASGLGVIAGQGGGTYQDIYTDAILNGTSAGIGGVVGFVNAGRGITTVFERCWSDSDITSTGRWKAGGIVGDPYTRGFIVRDCLNTGNITGTKEYMSGLVGGGGNNQYWSTFVIENSLNLGTVVSSGSSATAGAILGAKTQLSSLSDVYYLQGSSTKAFGQDGYSYENSATALTEGDLLGNNAANSLQGFDFDTVWTTVENGMPVLKALDKYASEAMPEETVVMTINTLEDLQSFATACASDNFFGKTVKLGADIVVNEGSAEDWAEGQNLPSTSWTPIARFAGTFDGNGHSISGVYIDTSDNFVGLFYEVDYTATIKNLKITNSYMKTTGFGLAPVVGKAVGYYKNIYTDCILEAGAMVGGIVGYNHPNGVASLSNKTPYTLVIENCWSNSDITTLSESSEVYGAGGILANGRFGFVIKNCLNTGNIYNAAKKRSGGIVGSFYTGKSADYGKEFSIINCLNLGQIQTESTEGTYAGAIMGTTYSSDLATNNTFTEAENIYYLDTSADAAFGSGGIATCVSASAAELTGTAARQTLLGFDFENVWATVEGGTPILKYFAE